MIETGEARLQWPNNQILLLPSSRVNGRHFKSNGTKNLCAIETEPKIMIKAVDLLLGN